MSDYAAAPIQPIVQGLLTIVAGAPVFTGVGVKSVVRTVGGAALGDFSLLLDPGLPGNAGELPPTGIGTALTIAVPDPRTLCTVRGAVATGATTINTIGVSYILPSVPPGDGGETTIRIVMQAGGAATDPVGAAGNGAEVITWKGV
jgi:hypothetical protein